MRTLHQQISEKCVHFNGLQHDKCDAGIAYQTHRDAGFPCFRGEAKDKLVKGKTPCQCEKQEWPTEEAVQAEIAMWDRESQKTNHGMKAVEQIRRDHKGQNWSGVIECPICNGRLHVSHAACNNHVHAQCETPGCLAWME